MAVFKCKMCGGTIEFNQGDTVGVCDSCGTKQTLPNVNDDAISSLYNRANTLRMKSEFDRAEELYNKIIASDETQAEAYWGIILCKFGIEYVEDPKTFKRVPTCHRTSFDAITADEDFKLAVKYGDAEQKKLYRAEAKAIDAIQKDILNIAKNEKPFDIFICYKETDESGKRTQDSVIANEIYHQLTQEGFKVFYAAITLEDKLGQEYEPYIFAALNSAKVMLVIGSRPEYFTAVWVKNEWSRFLKLMKKDRSKLLIPCYKDMDAYELPDDFAHLQAQNMSKIGFINDIVRGIKKVVDNDSSAPKKSVVKETVVMQNENGNVRALLDRGFMALEDGEWDKADGFFEQALNFDAKIAEAYLGKLMAELRVHRKEKLTNCEKPFYNSNNYQKAVRFGDDKLIADLEGYIKHINERKAEKRKIALSKAKKKAKKITIIFTPIIAGIIFVIILNSVIIPSVKYNSAVKMMNSGEYIEAIAAFEELYGYKESETQINECNYLYAVELYKAQKYDSAIAAFEKLNGYKDSKEQIENCNIGKYGEEKWNVIKNIKVGGTYKFGTYEQDNNTSNGKEDIEWLILAKEEDKLLLISDKALDRQPYNESNVDITWETCSLRKWMNTTFFNEAFSAEEQTRIQSTNVSADKNPQYDTDPGKATTDKVFLLSTSEVNMYLTYYEERQSVPTDYAIAKGAYKNTESIYVKDGAVTCSWWLRTSGYAQNNASVVLQDGGVLSNGIFVNNSICVRPAIWISIK